LKRIEGGRGGASLLMLQKGKKGFFELNKNLIIFFFLGTLAGSLFSFILISKAEFKGKIDYFGKIEILTEVSQSIKLDNKKFNEKIETKTKKIFSGETAFLGAHYIKNESVLPKRIKIITNDNPENLNFLPVEMVWQAVQITTGKTYKRNPSVLKDSRGNLWLFFSQDTYFGQEGKGCDEEGVNCENHQYEGYYIISQDQGISFSQPFKFPEIENFHPKIISPIEDEKGRIWVFLSDSKGEKGIYYFIINNGKFSEPKKLEIVKNNVDFVSVAKKENLIFVIYEDKEGSKIVWTKDFGESWEGPFLIDKRASRARGIFAKDGKLKIVWQNKETKKGIYLTDCNFENSFLNCSSSLVYLVEGFATEDKEPFLLQDSFSNFWLFWTVKEGKEKGKITQWINFATSSDLKKFSLPKILMKRENRWNFSPFAIENKNQIYLFFASENDRYSSEGRVNSNIWMAKLGKEIEIEILPKEKIGFDVAFIFRENLAQNDYLTIVEIKK